MELLVLLKVNIYLLERFNFKIWNVNIIVEFLLLKFICIISIVFGKIRFIGISIMFFSVFVLCVWMVVMFGGVIFINICSKLWKCLLYLL